MTLTVRKATRADIETFAGRRNNETIRAFVGDLDGKIIGIGGLAVVKGRYYAFCDLEPEMRSYKMHIMRTAMKVFANARRAGVRFVFAEADTKEPKSVAWLTRLGFEPDSRAEHLYKLRLNHDRN